MIRLRWPYWVAIGICLMLVWHVSHPNSVESVVAAVPAQSQIRPFVPISAEIQASATSAFVPLEIKSFSIASSTASIAPHPVFVVRDWTPPPPPAPKTVLAPPSPLPPQAPALPFRYMGRMQEEGGKTQVYLVNGDVLFTAKVGDTLDGTYMVQKIDRQEMALLYLPLNQTQTLPLGGD